MADRGRARYEDSHDYRPGALGHAVEVRLYARIRAPSSRDRPHRKGCAAARYRVDAGVAEGDEIGIAYDPMIAKLIAHGENARRGIDLSRRTRGDGVEGVTTTCRSLRWLVAHTVVRGRRHDDRLPQEHPPLSPAPARVRRRRADAVRLQRRSPCIGAAAGSGASGADHRGAAGGQSRVTAPMPGTVIRLSSARATGQGRQRWSCWRP